MSQNMAPSFQIECPECGIAHESESFDNSNTFAEKHEEHTGHEMEWRRADFDNLASVTEWRVLCMECDEAWHFEAEKEANVFKKDHAKYTDHKILSPICQVVGEPPEADEITDTADCQSLREIIGKLENYHEFGAPIEVIFAISGQTDLSIARIKQKLNDLKKKGEVYEPRSGYLRTI